MISKAMMVGSVLFSLALAAGAGTTRYVVPPGTPDVTPGGGFTGWATAATNIQNAVDASGASSQDFIWVSNGTYTVWNEISVAKDVTLSAFGGDAIVEAANYPSSTNRCLFLNHANALIGGLTFRKGTAVAANRSGCGGGVYLWSGTLSNCVVTLNVAAGNGGGVYLLNNTAVMRGGTVVSNTSSGSPGGGIFCSQGSAYGVGVYSNTANGNGGGIYAGGTSVIVSNCIAAFNRTVGGSDGGGMAALAGLVVDCLFSNNVSGQHGGGLYLSTTSVTGLNCRIVTNIANRAGGGLYLSTGSLAQGCRIYDNMATNPTTSGIVGGGGVYMTSGRLLDCFISNNQAPYAGGGIRADGVAWIDACDVSGNRSTNYSGGGIYAGVAGIVVTNCTISNNAAMKGQGGGLFVNSNGVTILNSTLCYNAAADKGGALKFGGDARILNSTIGPGNSADDGGAIAFFSGGIVSNCTIFGNIAKSGDGGGGFWTITYGELYNSYLISNRATTVSSGGGAGFCRNGMVMRNCLVTGNICTNVNKSAGGLYLDKIGVNTGRIENCTITVNQGYYRGGGVTLNSGNNLTTVVNCIVYDNTTVTGVAAEKDVYGVTAADTNAPIYSCFTGMTPAPNQGNITSDPGFVDPAGGDYRLKRNSPCRDAGMNLAWMAAATDLDGKARLVPADGTVDMGAYELPPSPGAMVLIR